MYVVPLFKLPFGVITVIRQTMTKPNVINMIGYKKYPIIPHIFHAYIPTISLSCFYGSIHHMSPLLYNGYTT